MGFSDVPEETEAKEILAAQKEQGERIKALTDAVNGLGANIQWIIDNVSGIFQMLHSPGMPGMLGAMMPSPDQMQEMAAQFPDAAFTENAEAVSQDG